MSVGDCIAIAFRADFSVPPQHPNFFCALYVAHAINCGRRVLEVRHRETFSQELRLPHLRWRIAAVGIAVPSAHSTCVLRASQNCLIRKTEPHPYVAAGLALQHRAQKRVYARNWENSLVSQFLL